MNCTLHAWRLDETAPTRRASAPGQFSAPASAWVGLLRQRRGARAAQNVLLAQPSVHLRGDCQTRRSASLSRAPAGDQQVAMRSLGVIQS